MSSCVKTVDICDLSTIYNDQFHYCVPEGVVKSFFDGNSFGREKQYSDDEKERLKKDISNIYLKIMGQNPVQGKLAVITAGAPGAGKTILLRQYHEKEAENKRNFAYVDPDDVCLKGLAQTWGSELEDQLKGISDDIDLEKKIREDGYNKWRPGSNAAAHIILANLILQNYSFYFGSTSSGDKTANTFNYLKEKGYRIHLIHVVAPDSIRWDSIKERDKSFVQTTEEDICNKGKLVAQRINDTYLKYADQIDFYYRNEVKKDAVHTATWIRPSKQDQKGELTIYNIEMYKAMVDVHNAICEKLKESESITWPNSVGKVSDIRIQ